jgi:hypothetical protein
MEKIYGNDQFGNEKNKLFEEIFLMGDDKDKCGSAML